MAVAPETLPAGPPRVLVLMDTRGAWSRGLLQGFAGVAHELGWTVLQYLPGTDLDWAIARLAPDAVVVGPFVGDRWPAALWGKVAVAANLDLSAVGVASVCVDDEDVARQAFKHLAERALPNLTVCRFDGAHFARVRESAFLDAAAGAGVRVAPGWWPVRDNPDGCQEDPSAIVEWLRALPKPCGIFTCCDSWGRVLASCARLGDVRVPEDVALVGVDNDRLECEFVVPSLSSVAIPWCNVGEQVARLLARGLAGQVIAESRVLVSPLHVVARRSSDTLAIADSLVSDAVRWIKDHAHERVTVPTVAAAVHSTRQRLERRFRVALGRTVAHEIRRSRVETAKGLLSSTPLALSQVARQCGFSTTALLSETFRRELGVSPGRFRRDMRRLGQEAAQGVEPTARAW